MKNQGKNNERTTEYYKKFDRDKLLASLIKKDKPVIFDIGANNGSSILEFKSIWEQSIIYSFEPQQECQADLRILQQKFQDSVFVYDFAIGSENKLNANFYSHDINSGVSGFNKINQSSIDSIDLNTKSEVQLNQYLDGLNRVREVEIKRLDSFIDSENINPSDLDILKIDTQGFEPEVLMGAGKLLTNFDLVITELMFFDFYEKQLSFFDIEKFLIPAGFKLYDISHISKNPMNGRTDWVDIIYINKSLYERS